jgi:threonine/homoserine/homoserine lactone efflux protein
VADSRTLLAFLVTCWVFVVIPGPSVLFVISRGVALGRRAALLTVVGNTAGVMVQVAAVAAGIGAIVERSILAYEVLRIGGALYIAYLGVQAVRHRRSLATVLDATAVRPRRQVLREGFVVGVSNPKAIVFLTAVLPQFADRSGALPVPAQLLVLGLILSAIALASDSLWALVAGTARSWLSSRPHRLERLGGTGGLVMIGLGTRLLVTGRHE